jgi:hypothetical protein
MSTIEPASAPLFTDCFDLHRTHADARPTRPKIDFGIAVMIALDSGSRKKMSSYFFSSHGLHNSEPRLGNLCDCDHSAFSRCGTDLFKICRLGGVRPFGSRKHDGDHGRHFIFCFA